MNVDTFKSKLSGGGARANLFQVRVNYPFGGDSELTSFMVKAAQLPASIIAPIEVPFRGRKIQIAGDRSFEPWTVTVINDTNFQVRNDMERWMHQINQHSTNEGVTNPLSYKADAYIDQLNKDGSVLKTYKFTGIFPTNVSAIEVAYETENTIEEFTVEFQVDYWTADGTE